MYTISAYPVVYISWMIIMITHVTDFTLQPYVIKVI